ncbi:MAG: cytochrome C [Cytophagaceae bacterium SCN 52-12]|nr:MAG: cytochrome C [Cytophagaceae bacterium SCN 52-12]
MKTLKKIAGWLTLLLLFVLLSSVTYVYFLLPDVGPAPDLKVDITPERIAHGEYLANHVVVCMDCHSQRDFSKFSGPIKEGTLGQGGEKFSEEFGFPGKFFARNITPSALSEWSDGDIYRAITAGVSKDGRAIFPVMPYKHYGMMDPEDVKDIIAYLRSIPPIDHSVPESEANFPFNFILNTIPQKALSGKKPLPSDRVAYGRYLANIGGCIECHTPPDDKGQKLPGMELAGGWEMSLGNGYIVTTANITPDPETGIGQWTEADFIARFKAYSDSGYVLPAVAPGEFQTIMPWAMYADMKSDDLAAIYAYLHTVEPVRNAVVKFREATPK